MLSDCYWRVRRRCTPFPSLAVTALPTFQDAVVNFGPPSKRSGSLSIRELDRLNPGQWISDDIIMAFLCKLLRISKNPRDTRFFAVDCQAVRRVEDGGIQNHSANIAFHDIDAIIWPFEYLSHWFLCIGYTDRRKVVLLDPYNPSQEFQSIKDSSKATHLALDGITQLTQNYDGANSISVSWTIESARNIPNLLPLPVQPPSNSSDCGVLVCLYIWSILTGESWRSHLLNITSFPKFMKDCRTNIKGIICDTVLLADTSSISSDHGSVSKA